jgi:hypothetical protein
MVVSDELPKASSKERGGGGKVNFFFENLSLVPETREVMEHFKLVFGSGTSDLAKIRPLKNWPPPFPGSHRLLGTSIINKEGHNGTLNPVTIHCAAHGMEYRRLELGLRENPNCHFQIEKMEKIQIFLLFFFFQNLNNKIFNNLLDFNRRFRVELHY